MKAPFPAPVNEWHNDTYPAIDPTRPELSAKGKKIVVTGGGSGIGKGVVEAFAIAGADSIAILGRREGLLLETKKDIESKYATRVSTHVADVTDEAAIKKIAKEIGTWHVLALNAGYLSTPDPILTSEVNDWWKAFEVRNRTRKEPSCELIVDLQINVKGTLIMAQSFIPNAGKGAAVVVTSSGIMLLPSEITHTGASYACSKLALNKFIEILAYEAPDVFFTTIQPGVVLTDMASKSGNADNLPQDTG
jgi:NAD(P)-dependent dehydrogenase (short-subunit alcohol dehydrogenase family)